MKKFFFLILATAILVSFSSANAAIVAKHRHGKKSGKHAIAKHHHIKTHRYQLTKARA
jgi:hypothetical protein